MLRGVVDKPDAADDASPPQQRTGVGAVYRGLGMARVLRKSVRILAKKQWEGLRESLRGEGAHWGTAW